MTGRRRGRRRWRSTRSTKPAVSSAAASSPSPSPDTKSEAAEGARAGQEVIAEGADLMIVSCDYDMGAAAATVANSNGMVVISLCASDAKMGVQGIGPYAFTMSNSSLTSGAVIAEWAWNKKGWKTAYNLLDTSIEYDKTDLRRLQDPLREAGRHHVRRGHLQAGRCVHRLADHALQAGGGGEGRA